MRPNNRPESPTRSTDVPISGMELKSQQGATKVSAASDCVRLESLVQRLQPRRAYIIHLLSGFEMFRPFSHQDVKFEGPLEVHR